jgi:hypothetical protein
MQLEGKSGLSIVEACDTARLSRAGFYRHFDEHAPRQADTDLREQIQPTDLSPPPLLRFWARHSRTSGAGPAN